MGEFIQSYYHETPWDDDRHERLRVLLASGISPKDVIATINREERAKDNAENGVETIAAIPIPNTDREFVIEHMDDTGSYLFAQDRNGERLASIIVPMSIVGNITGVLLKDWKRSS